MDDEEGPEELELADEYEVDVDDEAIQEGISKLLNIPLEFMEDSEDEEGGVDDVERQLEALFDGDETQNVIELENISDNELSVCGPSGPESGECETSDGELPDSPNGAPPVITVEDSPIMVLVSDDEIEAVDAVISPRKRSLTQEEREKARQIKSREKNVESGGNKRTSPLKSTEATLVNPEGEKLAQQEKRDVHERKERRKSSPSKTGKRHDLPIKLPGDVVSNTETAVLSDVEKREIKFKKYLARMHQYRQKCLQMMGKVSPQLEKLTPGKTKSKVVKEFNRIKSAVVKPTKIKSVVDPTENNIEGQSMNNLSVVALDSQLDLDAAKRRSSPSKSKTEKWVKTKPPKETKEHKNKHQSNKSQKEHGTSSEKRTSSPEKHKGKSRKKHKKGHQIRGSSSPEKCKKEPRIQPPVLSFLELCEDVSPPKRSPITKTVEPEARKERTISSDSGVTTSSLRSENIDSVDEHEDKDLFITITELVEQDKKKGASMTATKVLEKRSEPEDLNKTKTVDNDPELKSLTVFTKVLFKDDEPGIPFLQGCPPSPPEKERAPASKRFMEVTGPDEIYDCLDEQLETISPSSLSPAPSPKVHNKALLNFVESQKELEGKKKKHKKRSKSSRSRSKSPRREKSKLKKRKKHHHSSMSVSSSSPHVSPDRRRRPSPRASPPPRSVTPPPAPTYRKRSVTPPAPTYRKRSVTPPPAPTYRKRSVTPPAPTYRKRSVTPPPAPTYRKRSVTPPPTYRKRSSGSPPDQIKERWKDHHTHSHPHPQRPRKRSRSRTRSRAHSRSRSSSRERAAYRSRPLRSPQSPAPHPRTRSRSRSNTHSLEEPEDTKMVQEKRRRLKEEHERALDSLRATMRKPPPADTMSCMPVSVKFNPVGLDSYEAWRGDNYDPVGMSEIDASHSQPVVTNGPQDKIPHVPADHNGIQLQPTHPSHPLPASDLQHPMTNMDSLSSDAIDVNPPLPAEAPPQPPAVPSASQELYTTYVPLPSLPPPWLPPPMQYHPPPYPPYQVPPAYQHYPTHRLPVPSFQPPAYSVVSTQPPPPGTCRHADPNATRDPRVQIRKKSPEKATEILRPPGDDKVKITLNSFKPRPIAAVGPNNIHEAEFNVDSCKKSVEMSNKSKPDSYVEKSYKIEGIVSKLKYTINDSVHEDVPVEDKNGDIKKSVEAKITGDEPYDPFNADDEEPELDDSTSKTNLSEGQLERLNEQIRNCFSCILSNSEERKRLTPTLDAINAKKIEIKNKANKVESVKNKANNVESEQKLNIYDSMSSKQSELLQTKAEEYDMSRVKDNLSSDGIATVEIVNKQNNIDNVKTIKFLETPDKRSSDENTGVEDPIIPLSNTENDKDIEYRNENIDVLERNTDNKILFDVSESNGNDEKSTSKVEVTKYDCDALHKCSFEISDPSGKMLSDIADPNGKIYETSSKECNVKEECKGSSSKEDFECDSNTEHKTSLDYTGSFKEDGKCSLKDNLLNYGTKSEPEIPVNLVESSEKDGRFLSKGDLDQDNNPKNHLDLQESIENNDKLSSKEEVAEHDNGLVKKDSQNDVIINVLSNQEIRDCSNIVEMPQLEMAIKNDKVNSTECLNTQSTAVKNQVPLIQHIEKDLEQKRSQSSRHSSDNKLNAQDCHINSEDSKHSHFHQSPYSSDLKCNPALSIPTKAELKRFPSPKGSDKLIQSDNQPILNDTTESLSVSGIKETKTILKNDEQNTLESKRVSRKKPSKKFNFSFSCDTSTYVKKTDINEPMIVKVEKTETRNADTSKIRSKCHDKNKKRNRHLSHTVSPISDDNIPNEKQEQISKLKKEDKSLKQEESQVVERKNNLDEYKVGDLCKTPSRATRSCDNKIASPLSKKCQSFISQNLPTTFNLIRDAELIRKGFNKIPCIILTRIPAVSSSGGTRYHSSSLDGGGAKHFEQDVPLAKKTKQKRAVNKKRKK